MIILENVSKTYSGTHGTVRALDAVSLSVARGEIYGIIGLSGAGKSTLIRTVNRLENVDSGIIRVENEVLNTLNEKALRKKRQKIGMIFQHFHLMSSRTVYENIAFPLEIAKVGKENIKQRVDELLRLVELEDKANAYPSQLSGGQKQRVAIARALANDPNILLCDEATSALDPITTRSILNLLYEINQKLGLTILLITHEMEVISAICTNVAVMENGKIIEEGEVQEVISSPKADITRAFLNKQPIQLNHIKSEFTELKKSNSVVEKQPKVVNA